LWSSLYLDKFKLTDSVSEKDSEKSIQNNTNDVFVEVQEKLSAVFNVSGFAIYIKISGMIFIKNYIHNRLNLRINMNDEFSVGEEVAFSQTYKGITLGYNGRDNYNVSFSRPYLSNSRWAGAPSESMSRLVSSTRL